MVWFGRGGRAAGGPPTSPPEAWLPTYGPPQAGPREAAPPPPPPPPSRPPGPPSAAGFLDLPTEAPLVGDPRQGVVPALAPVTSALPGLRADGGLLAGRWVAAASLAGQSHLRAGTTPQDAYQYTVTDDGTALVLAVCDGLGSRPRTSQIGAVLLADRICAEAAALTARDLADDPEAALRAVLHRASAAAARYREAVLPGLADSDLASTAAVCVLPVGGSAGWAARVGDCAVLTLTDAGWGTVFGADDGPLNMVSGSLPHPDPGRVTECAPIAPGRPGLVVLATDGLAEDVFSSPGVRDWLAERWSAPCGAARMADALRYRRRGSHDDRTALVVWPPHPETGA